MNTRTVQTFLFAIAVTLAAATGFSGRTPAEELVPAARQMLEDVKILASDEYEGRGVGTQGLNRAAEYIATEFEKAGLNVKAEQGDAYQDFEVNAGAKLGAVNLLTLHGPEGKAIDLKYDENFRTCAFGGSGKFNAPIALVGYGIDAPDVEYNDYANIDVKNKVVLLMRRNPQQANPHGPFAVAHGVSRHAALTTKVSQAFSHGAAAVLIVNDPMTGRNEKSELQAQVEKARQSVIDAATQLTAADANLEELVKPLRQALDHLKQVTGILEIHASDPLMPFGYGGSRAGKSIPCFQISIETANDLLKNSLGIDLERVEKNIDETGKPFSRDLTGWTASGEATVETIQIPVKNVIGVLEGTGPLREETIIIGAHFDHLGRGDEGTLAANPDAKEIHNGADDNASGTAGLLELARRLGRHQPPLPRRLVFIGFTGEERGLLGSLNYVENPLFPLKETVAMFNMDMIGRMEDDKLVVFGTGTSSRWNALVDQAAAAEKLTISKKPEGFGPSDHASFYAKDIPVLHLFTGTHSDYHRPSDDWEKLNLNGMDRIIQFLEQIVIATATAETRPDFIEVKGTASLERTGSRPYFGSIPDFAKEADGYAIQGVAADSPAEKAGLKAGDVIVRISDRRVGGLEDFDLALRNYKAGEQITVVVLRDGQEVTLNVTLSTPRG